MAIARALGLAAAFATGRDATAAGAADAQRVESLAWLPLAGAVLGALAALAGAAFTARGGAALAAVAVLRGAVRPARWRLGWLVATACELAAVAALAPAARAVAIVVAAMLARWACVVQCYGGRAAPGATGMAALAGRVGFREFGIASVVALGTTLVLLDAVGLAVAVASAVVTLAVRAAVYARRDGIDAGALDATSALVETSALGMLTLIGLLFGSAR